MDTIYDDDKLRNVLGEYRTDNGFHGLMRCSNTVLSRDQRMTLTRGRDVTAFDRSIDLHISKLRAKFGTMTEKKSLFFL